MKTSEQVTLQRDCEAIQIPSGAPVLLPAGSEVRIRQALGGTYTVMISNGSLVRIAEGDRDALGKATEAAPTAWGASRSWLNSASSLVRKVFRRQSQTSEAAGEYDRTTGVVAPPDVDLTSADLEQRVWERLQSCFDPEIPVNIVELGLVYHCQVAPLPDGGHRVEVKFTLTAPGCGMGDVLKADIERKIRQLPGVTDLDVEVVFEPPWNQDMMSEAAKLELGML